MLKFDELFEAFSTKEEKNNLNLNLFDDFWEEFDRGIRLDEDEFEKAFGKPKDINELA